MSRHAIWHNEATKWLYLKIRLMHACYQSRLFESSMSVLSVELKPALLISTYMPDWHSRFLQHPHQLQWPYWTLAPTTVSSDEFSNQRVVVQWPWPAARGPHSRSLTPQPQQHGGENKMKMLTGWDKDHLSITGTGQTDSPRGKLI